MSFDKSQKLYRIFDLYRPLFVIEGLQQYQQIFGAATPACEI